MRADRTNRFALTVLGVLLLLAGAAAMAASAGEFGTAFSRRTLFANRVGGYVGQHGSWVWPAAAGAGLILALLMLRWLTALLIGTDRAGDIIVPDGDDQGTTIIRPAALTSALTREISSYHGVEAAKGRVVGDGGNPELVLTVTTAASADLHALHQRIEAEAIAHARQALGLPSLPVRLDLA
jgi:hypothetical protein